MASRGDIEAGKAFVTLYVKNSALTKGLAAISSAVKGVGSTIMGIGAGIAVAGASAAAALGGAVAVFASMGSELADVAARTGETVGSLAELKFAAEQTGAELSDVELAIKTMQRKGIAGTFDEIAAKIAAIEDPAKRTQMAIENWGKAGTKLLPMVDGLQDMRAQARGLGLVPTEQAVRDADTIGDLFDQIKSVGKAAMFEIGAAVAPIVIPALEAVRTLGQAVVLAAKQVPVVLRAIGSVLSSVGGHFGDLRDTFLTTWRGIVDAIQAGDLTEAGRIAVLGLQVVWEGAQLKMLEAWLRTKEAMLTAWDELSIELQGDIAFIKTAFIALTEETVASFKGWTVAVVSMWNLFEVGAKVAIAKITVYVTQLINKLLLMSRTITTAINIALIGAGKTPEAQDIRKQLIGANVAANVAANFADVGAGVVEDRAQTEREKAMAEARLRANDAAGLRGVKDAAVLAAQEGELDAVRKRLKDAAGELAKARKEADAKPKAKFGLGLGDPGMIEEIKTAARTAVFSNSAALVAGAGGGNPQDKVVKEVVGVRKIMEKVKVAIENNQLQVVG